MLRVVQYFLDVFKNDIFEKEIEMQFQKEVMNLNFELNLVTISMAFQISLS
jgi:hypothetical protein